MEIILWECAYNLMTCDWCCPSHLLSSQDEWTIETMPSSWPCYLSNFRICGWKRSLKSKAISNVILIVIILNAISYILTYNASVYLFSVNKCKSANNFYGNVCYSRDCTNTLLSELCKWFKIFSLILVIWRLITRCIGT